MSALSRAFAFNGITYEIRVDTTEPKTLITVERKFIVFRSASSLRAATFSSLSVMSEGAVFITSKSLAYKVISLAISPMLLPEEASESTACKHSPIEADDNAENSARILFFSTPPVAASTSAYVSFPCESDIQVSANYRRSTHAYGKCV